MAWYHRNWGVGSGEMRHPEHRKWYQNRLLQYSVPALLLLAGGTLGYTLGYNAATKKESHRQPAPQPVVQQTAEKKKPELPRLAQGYVGFNLVEPVDVSDQQIMDYIKSSIDACRLSGNTKNGFTTSSIDQAYFSDIDGDDRKEIIVITETNPYFYGAARRFELYSIQRNPDEQGGETEYFGPIEADMKPENVRVVDVTGDGKGDIIFTAALNTYGSPYPYTFVASSEFTPPTRLEGVRAIRNFDGDNLPEFCLGDEFAEWDGTGFSSDAYIQNSLLVIKNAMAGAAANTNEIQRISVARDLEQLYSPEIISFCTSRLLQEPQFGQVLHPYQHQQLLKMGLPEFLALSFVQHAAREYVAMEEEKARIRLLVKIGGDPEIHELSPSAEGVGVSEKHDYTPPPDPTIVKYQSGNNTEIKEVYPTKEAADRRWGELWQQDFSRRRRESYRRLEEDVSRGIGLAGQTASKTATDFQKALGDILKSTQQKHPN